MSKTKNTGVKYPQVEVELIGQDGNAFHILGAVQKALRNAGVPAEEVSAYYTEATSGDYDHLLQVTLQWVNVA